MTPLQRAPRPLPGILLALVLGLASAGCSRDAGTLDASEGEIAVSGGEDAGEVTLISDDSVATVPPVCVGDIPEDLTACAGAPANLGEVELTASLTAAVTVPRDLATSGYELRINGVVPPTIEPFINDLTVSFQVPQEIVDQPGPTIVTVEANSLQGPMAVWQFLLSDPAGAAG